MIFLFGFNYQMNLGGSFSCLLLEFCDEVVEIKCDNDCFIFELNVKFGYIYILCFINKT